MLAQFDKGDLRGMKQLAARFRASGAQFDPQSVLEAECGSGIIARRSDDGKQILLDIPNHGTMPFAEALRLKLVTVTKK
jgi:hypothetical protein